jgi:PEP-CTERM motif
MKKLVLFVLLTTIFCFSAEKSYSTVAPSSLGSWNEGDAGSTHQRWDFTPGYISSTGAGYTAIPEEVSNPDPMFVVATISTSGTWDGNSTINGSWIYVNLEIPNYKILNPCKEIWVDIGGSGLLTNSIAVSAAGNEIKSTDYRYEILNGQGDADFGIKIYPNPEIEKIGFMLMGTTAPAMLDYIHVDTICIPEPTTICLLGLGALSLLRIKKSK